MEIMNPYLSIITLKVYRLDFSIKGQRMAKYIQTQAQWYAANRSPTFALRTDKAGNQRMERYSKQIVTKRGGHGYTYIKKLRLQFKMVTRDKKICHIMIKGSIHEEGIIVNI